MNIPKQSSTRWHGFVHAVHFGFSGGLVFLTLAAMVVAYVLSPAWLQRAAASGYGVFSGTSFWNTRLPRYPVARATDVVASSFASQVAGGVVLDTSNQAAPVYIAQPDDQTQVVTPWDCDGSGAGAEVASQWQAVPLPSFAASSSGALQRLVVFRPSTQTVWEFQGMRQIAGQWQACHGGRIDAVSSMSGRWSGLGGDTASGLALLGGQIAVADLRRGTIGHAIGLALPGAGGSANWPATRSATGGSVPFGTRLQLDPAVDVASLGLSTVGRQIAEAAQTYGFVVWDTASSPSVYAEDPVSFTSHGLPDPYGAFGGLSLAGFPWASVRALPDNYGQSGETPSITDFSTPASVLTLGQQTEFNWSAINVDSCAIPGLADSLSNQGSRVGNDLTANTNYTLTCSGPGGSTSRTLTFSVPHDTSVRPPSPPTTTTIDLPLSGAATVLPDFDSAWARESVHKVTYYERQHVLQETTTPPFRLQTDTLPDGPHALELVVSFRDGHEERHQTTLHVQNIAAHLDIGMATAPKVASLGPWGVVLAVTCFACMLACAWYGWRRAKRFVL